jgi:hypothetical protein
MVARSQSDSELCGDEANIFNSRVNNKIIRNGNASTARAVIIRFRFLHSQIFSAHGLPVALGMDFT